MYKTKQCSPTIQFLYDGFFYQFISVTEYKRSVAHININIFIVININNFGTNIFNPSISSFTLLSTILTTIESSAFSRKDDKETEEISEKLDMYSKAELSEIFESLNGFMIQILFILSIRHPMITSNQQLIELCNSYQMKVIRSLNKLEELGLVKRINSLNDARIKGNYLTDAGIKLIDTFRELLS